MKKILILATSALLISGATFADGGKKNTAKKANCPKGKTCGKSCSKNKGATAAM